MTETHEPGSENAQPSIARRVFSKFLRGLGPEDIGAQENVSSETVEAIVREELDERWVPTIADFAKLQIARLEDLTRKIADSVERRELKAVDRMLKILDRMDRYHGFTRGSPAAEPYGDDERDKLLEKINAIADRLDDPPTAQ